MAKIVVGVDGSEGSAAALRWAVTEGAVRQLPVTAVMAWGLLDQHHAVPGADFDPAYGEPEATAALEAAIVAAVPDDQGAAIDKRVVCDLAPSALLDAAGDDDLLVVGARGLGGFKGLLLGSVSQQVLTGATGPVAVVRPGHEERLGAPVVVGVEGSDAAQRALSWALDEGRARGVEVQVVHGWSAPFVGAYPFGGATFEPAMFEDAAREVIDQVMATADITDVVVAKKLAYGTGGGALLEAAEGAGLVVVGSRGLTGVKGWLLGSVSQQVVHHAPCTVVVIPAAS